MTAGIHITRHAACRFIERVAPLLTEEQARDEIRTHERAITVAADFHAPTDILGCGARLVLDGRSVVTVLGRRPR
jgi:hypothetical protein